MSAEVSSSKRIRFVRPFPNWWASQLSPVPYSTHQCFDHLQHQYLDGESGGMKIHVAFDTHSAGSSWDILRESQEFYRLEKISGRLFACALLPWSLAHLCIFKFLAIHTFDSHPESPLASPPKLVHQELPCWDEASTGQALVLSSLQNLPDPLTCQTDSQSGCHLDLGRSPLEIASRIWVLSKRKKSLSLSGSPVPWGRGEKNWKAWGKGGRRWG